MRKNPLLRFFQELMELGFESFGRYYSSYRAFVTSVEDPLNINRIKVMIPEVTDEEHGVWAYPKGNFSGVGYGVQMLPKPGDLVWVEFERGNPAAPFWSHGHFGKNEKPKRKDLDDKDNIWFVSPKGHKIIINDTDESILVESKAGDQITITKKSVSLVTDKKISLGGLDDSKQQAVLGNELKTLLTDMHTLINRINTDTTLDIAASVAAGQPYLMFVNRTKSTAQNIKDLATIKLQLEKILSNLVKLN